MQRLVMGVFVAATAAAAPAWAQGLGQDPLTPVSPESEAECRAYSEAMTARLNQLLRDHQSCVDGVNQSCKASAGGDIAAENRCTRAETNPAFYNDVRVSLYSRCQYLKDAYYRADAAKTQGVAACRQQVEAYEASNARTSAGGSGRGATGGAACGGSSNRAGGNDRRGPVTVDQVPGASAIRQLGATLSGLLTSSPDPRETSGDSTAANPSRLGGDAAPSLFQPLLATDDASANSAAVNSAIDDILKAPSANAQADASWTGTVVRLLAGPKPWDSVGFTTLTGIGTPAAAIPFALLSPILDANLTALDQVSVVLGDFDNAHSGDVDRIFRDYQAEVLAPEQWLKRIMREAIAGFAANTISEAVVVPRLNPTISDARGATFYWWSERRGADHLRRDVNGIPLLRNTAGDLHAYDPATNSVAYSRSEAEELVSSGAFSPVRDQRTTAWERNHITFLPAERDRLRPLGELAVSSAAETWIGLGVQEALDKIESVGTTFAQRTRKMAQLKKWLDEERERQRTAR